MPDAKLTGKLVWISAECGRNGIHASALREAYEAAADPAEAVLQAWGSVMHVSDPNVITAAVLRALGVPNPDPLDGKSAFIESLKLDDPCPSCIPRAVPPPPEPQEVFLERMYTRNPHLRPENWPAEQARRKALEEDTSQDD